MHTHMHINTFIFITRTRVYVPYEFSRKPAREVGDKSKKFSFLFVNIDYRRVRMHNTLRVCGFIRTPYRIVNIEFPTGL